MSNTIWQDLPITPKNVDEVIRNYPPDVSSDEYRYIKDGNGHIKLQIHIPSQEEQEQMGPPIQAGPRGDVPSADYLSYAGASLDPKAPPGWPGPFPGGRPEAVPKNPPLQDISTNSGPSAINILSTNAASPYNLQGYFQAALAAPDKTDPLLLDLNGDGIQTTNYQNAVLFDQNKTGFSILTNWADKNDGILVVDKNDNGVIDNGGEVFGNQMTLSGGGTATDGYAALADYDGVSDANDTNFSDIKILMENGCWFFICEKMSMRI